MKNRPFAERLGFALAGLRDAWRRERSFRTHIACAALALAALVILRPAAVWWAIVGLAAALVIAAEIINSALERLADYLHPDLHPEIKAVKDMAAAAVLVFAIAALWVGFFLLVSLL